ncbi:MAG: sigma-70 family RNA polymerase sigma factor [Spirochaetota bacterium]
MKAADLLNDHGDALYAYARTRLTSDDDIADCIQETLLAAIRNADTFSGNSSVRTWLIGILRFKIIDIYRKQAREADYDSIDAAENDTYFDEAGHWELQRAPRAWEKSPLEQLEQSELREHLHRCIGRLPKVMRAAITLRELEACETAEICKQLVVTSTHLHVILYRARMHLRTCLEQFGFKGISS